MFLRLLWASVDVINKEIMKEIRFVTNAKCVCVYNILTGGLLKWANDNHHSEKQLYKLQRTTHWTR